MISVHTVCKTVILLIKSFLKLIIVFNSIKNVRVKFRNASIAFFFIRVAQSFMLLYYLQQRHSEMPPPKKKKEKKNINKNKNK